MKYNRVLTLQRTGLRFTADKDKYDLVIMVKISGSMSFKERSQASRLTKITEKEKV